MRRLNALIVLGLMLRFPALVSAETWTSQLGVKAEKKPPTGIMYFLQFITSPRLDNQFYSQDETVWGAGLKFRLSQDLFTHPSSTNPSPLHREAVAGAPSKATVMATSLASAQ